MRMVGFAPLNYSSKRRNKKRGGFSTDCQDFIDRCMDLGYRDREQTFELYDDQGYKRTEVL